MVLKFYWKYKCWKHKNKNKGKYIPTLSKITCMKILRHKIMKQYFYVIYFCYVNFILEFHFRGQLTTRSGVAHFSSQVKFPGLLPTEVRNKTRLHRKIFHLIFLKSLETFSFIRFLPSKRLQNPLLAFPSRPTRLHCK